MKKTKLDDGFYPYLVAGTDLVGEPGIPSLLDYGNTQIPKDLVPFEKAKLAKTNRRQYVHFYMHDKGFEDLLTSTSKYVDLLKEYDGVITPDCSMLRGQAKCLQQTNTYFNRAIGCYLQRQGIPVIPNVRWSDENSFDYCFLGVPTNGIVAISTHGCIRSSSEKYYFRLGLEEMLKQLNPTDVIVHGFMPESVFCDYSQHTNFHRYKSQFEKTHCTEVE